MNLTNLWDRAIKHSIFDRSVDGVLGAMRQAVRPFGQPRSAPPQSCHGRAAALVVLGLLALALPEAAQAQPVQTLISNFGQTAAPASTTRPDVDATFRPSQNFTTGPNPAGYGLDSIRVHFPIVTAAPDLTASIWTTKNSPSPGTTVDNIGNPAAKQFDLINPTDITTPGEDKIFTAEANTKLDPLTTYAVVFETTGGNMEVDITESRAEDAGGAPDWSIADHRQAGFFFLSLTWTVIGTEPTPLRIEVKGTILVDSPDEPRYLRAKTGHAQVVLSWIAPESAGGTPITKYQYRYSASAGDMPTVDERATWTDVPDGADADVPVGADTDIANQTTVTVTGLTNGTQYAFEVQAVNSLGAGTAATVKATPRLTLTITWDEQAARSQPSFTVTFTFSEAVEGFDAEDLENQNILVSPAMGANFQVLSATTYTYTIDVTPDADTEFVNIYVHKDIARAITSRDQNSQTVAAIPLLPPVTGTSTDATLSALTLEDASDDSAITISPVFAAGTTSYMASVDNDVDEITITPTVNESNATVEYLDSSDADITDADGVKTGQQVSLSEGANTIKVKVTAADANTPPQTYTVMVTRVADTVPGSANVLVSNAGQSPNSSNNSSGDRAQAFTTVAGATLSSVEIISSDPAGDDLAVSLCTTDSSGYPTSSCTALTAPASFAAGTLVFTDPASTTLAANTTYSLLLVSPGNDFLNLSATTSDAEDTGGAAGWTIANAYNSKSGTVWVTTASNSSFLITIKGTLGTTTTPNTAPGAPTGLTATANGPSRINLAWAAPGDTGGTAITGYKIEVSPDGSSSWTDLVANTESTATTYAHTGLTAATTRHYRVSAINAVGTSVASDSDDATTTAAPPPPTRPAPPPQGRRSPPSTPPPPPGDVVGYLENPGAASFQSGIGLISGWVCDAEAVEIVLNGEPQEAAYGTARLDTEAVCGDSDNGFGLLFNWNLLGDGEHEVVALVDGVELDRATVTVTTLGVEFLRDVTGRCTAADFPTGDETVTLAWQQTQQNFVIVDGPAPAGTTNRMGTPGVGYLENPGPNSFQSGIGVLSGWACEGTEVVIELNGQPQPAAYGTERLDTLEMCGDTANGFGLLFNWNLLGEGEHEVVAVVDGEELGRATVRVTTLGAEFVLGAEGECVVKDFPMPGETVTLEWQQNSQNFVITDVE